MLPGVRRPILSRKKNQDKGEDPRGISTASGDLERLVVGKANIRGQRMRQVIHQNVNTTKLLHRLEAWTTVSVVNTEYGGGDTHR